MNTYHVDVTLRNITRFFTGEKVTYECVAQDANEAYASVNCQLELSRRMTGKGERIEITGIRLIA